MNVLLYFMISWCWLLVTIILWQNPGYMWLIWTRLYVVNQEPQADVRPDKTACRNIPWELSYRSGHMNSDGTLGSHKVCISCMMY